MKIISKINKQYLALRLNVCAIRSVIFTALVLMALFHGYIESQFLCIEYHSFPVYYLKFN
jgi:hypothetical protein